MSLFFICSPCLFGVWSKLSYCCNHCYRPISDNYLFVVRHTISNYSRLHSKFIWFPPIKMQRVLKKRKKKKKKSFFFFFKVICTCWTSWREKCHIRHLSRCKNKCAGQQQDRRNGSSGGGDEERSVLWSQLGRSCVAECYTPQYINIETVW